MIKYIIKKSFLIAVIAVALNLALAFSVHQTYTTLTKESVIAKIKFEKLEHHDNIFKAILFTNKNGKIGEYTIYGNQWRIDVGFIKMKYWVNALGYDSAYTLNRIEGRYQDISDQNSKIVKSYEIEDQSIVELFDFLIDTKYGSSAYESIDLDKSYTVLKSQTGLIIR